jgi:hypothetical protein
VNRRQYRGIRSHRRSTWDLIHAIPYPGRSGSIPNRSLLVTANPCSIQEAAEAHRAATFLASFEHTSDRLPDSRPSSPTAFSVVPTVTTTLVDSSVLSAAACNEAEADELDWREQTFYWSGKLDYDDSTRCVRWIGNWLGSFTGRPPLEELQSSKNSFLYFSQVIDKARVFSNGAFLKPCSGFYRGSYVVDDEEEDDDDGDGDGDSKQERCEDKECLIEFEEQVGRLIPFYSVYGKGDSEFGKFVLHGSFDAGTRVLDLVRQYLSDADPKADMSLMQLKQLFKRGLSLSTAKFV